MIKNTEEDLGLQGFSARHPIGRFFLHQATEHEFGEAIFKLWGKTIRFPIIIVIAGEALHITDYVSTTTFLGSEDQSATDQASFDPAVLIGWCLPAIASLLFFVFTFTPYYTWRTYRTFVPIVMFCSMVFHVLPTFVSSPDDGDGRCEGESELLAEGEQLAALRQGLAQIAAEQGAWYVSKSFFYLLCVALYSTCLPITLLLFCVINGLYFAKNEMQWEQQYCAQLSGLAPNLWLSGVVALILLVVTDHARRRQFVLNALLRRSTDARLERLAHEQLVKNPNPNPNPNTLALTLALTLTLTLILILTRLSTLRCAAPAGLTARSR